MTVKYLVGDLAIMTPEKRRPLTPEKECLELKGCKENNLKNVDVKIPLFPSTTPEEGFVLLQALCKRRKLVLNEGDFAEVKALIPDLLTPGAAEALAVKAFRLSKTQSLAPLPALKAALQDYQAPVSRDIMNFQIEIARVEATDLSFVPERFRKAQRSPDDVLRDLGIAPTPPPPSA